jgi:hypothetical protein
VRRSPGTPLVALVALVALVVLLARAAWADPGEPTPEPPGEPTSEPPGEPPAEAPEGVDYESEIADSVETGTAETGFGATGRGGGRPHARRRVRFSDGGFSGEAREGTDDPLAGAMVESRTAHGRWTAGRFRPLWACGLALGGPAEPWRRPARSAGAGAAPGTPAGSGVRWQAGSPSGRTPPGARRTGFDALAARFAGGDVAGARARIRGASLGALVSSSDRGPGRSRRARAQASVGLEYPDLLAELAMDPSGRWSAEAELGRALGRAQLTARARGGLEGFHPIAGTRHASPPQALAVRLESLGPGAGVRLAGALWRFRPGLTGARASLEFAGRLAHDDHLAAGFEEQHGARRETDTHPDRFRQGAWGEWRGGSDGLKLVLREEWWGEGAWVRGTVRSVSAAGVEIAGPARSMLRISHCAYRVRRGESLYLPEAESDRLVLRALSGVGERTRIETQLPLAGGVGRAAAAWTAVSAPPRVQWTLDWSRRASIRRSK